MDVEPEVQAGHRFHAVPWPVDTTGRSAPLKAAIRGLGNIKSEKVQKIIERVFDLGKATFIARCEVNRANQRAKDEARDKAITERNIQNAQNTVASQEKALADAIAVAKAAKERLDATKAAAAGAE